MSKRREKNIERAPFEEVRREEPEHRGRHLWEITAVRDLFCIALAIAALLLVHYLWDVLMPVLIGLGLAYLFNPIIDRAEQRWHIPRPATTLLLLVVLAVAAIFLLAWSGPILVGQAISFIQALPGYIDRVSSQYGLSMGDLPEQIRKAGEAIKRDPIATLQTLFTGTGRFFGVVGNVIGVTTEAIVFVMLVPIYFFFFAWRFPAILAWFSRFIPASRKARVVGIAQRMDNILAAFFRARLLICLLMGAMFAFGWTLARVPYAFLLGLVAGFLSLVPFASVVAWPLALLLKYLEVTAGAESFHWTEVLLWPSMVYFVVQFIEGWILTPLIHRGSTNLSAVTILIVVFIGGALGGFIGVILAIPLASLIKIILDESLLPRLEAWASRS